MLVDLVWFLFATALLVGIFWLLFLWKPSHPMVRDTRSFTRHGLLLFFALATIIRLPGYGDLAQLPNQIGWILLYLYSWRVFEWLQKRRSTRLNGDAG